MFFCLFGLFRLFLESFGQPEILVAKTFQKNAKNAKKAKKTLFL